MEPENVILNEKYDCSHEQVFYKSICRNKDMKI